MSSIEGMPFATDVVQFISLVVFQLITVLVFVILFLALRGRWPELFGPHRPDGPLVTAKGLIQWILRLREVDDDALLEAGGVDGVLYCWRAAMHAELVAILVCTSFPLAIIYALASDANAGLARITFANALAPPVGGWQLWLAVLGVWVNTLIALRAVDRFDADVAAYTVRHLRTSPPLHHYCAVVTDLPKSAVRDEVGSFFSKMHGDNVISVHQLRKYSVPVSKAELQGRAAAPGSVQVGGVDDDAAPPPEPTMKDKLLGKKIPNGSLRLGVEVYAACLKKLASADNAAIAEAKKNRDKGQAKTKKADKARVARAEAAQARAALNAALATAPQFEPDGNGPEEAVEGKLIPPRARSAVVAFDSLKTATAAITAPLLVAGAEGAMPGRAWVLWPAPEPRDIEWMLLENLKPARTRENSSMINLAIKSALTVWWSLLIALLQAAIVAALQFAAQIPLVPLQTALIILSAIVPLAIQDFMLNFMATILRVLNTKLGGYWSKSAIERSVQHDYTVFLRIVAFFAAMLGSSLFAALVEIGSEPTRIFSLLATSVPASSGVMMAYVFLRACSALKNALGVIRAIVGKVKLALLAKTPFAASEVGRAPPFGGGVKTAWDGFVLIVALAYAPIAPLTAFICLLYFAAASLEARVDVVSVSAPLFDSAGALAALGAQQAMDAVTLAALIHFAVILLSGSAGAAWHVFAILPLPIPVIVFRARMAKRHALGPHGAPRGRLPLVDASAVDAARSVGHTKSLQIALSSELKAWTPPCVPGASAGGLEAGRGSSAAAAGGGGGGGGALRAPLPPLPPPPTGPDSEVDESGLFALYAWLRRYESAHAVTYTSPSGGEDEAAAAAAIAAAQAAAGAGGDDDDSEDGKRKSRASGSRASGGRGSERRSMDT